MFEISSQLVQGLINYLATKPYAEAYQAIAALQSLKPVGEKLEKTLDKPAPETKPDDRDSINKN